MYFDFGLLTLAILILKDSPQQMNSKALSDQEGIRKFLIL